MNTIWATKEDINKLTELWYAMTTKMEEVEGIPRPSLGKVKEVNELFNKEYNQGNLMFRIVKDNAGTIIVCFLIIDVSSCTLLSTFPYLHH